MIEESLRDSLFYYLDCLSGILFSQILSPLSAQILAGSCSEELSSDVLLALHSWI